MSNPTDLEIARDLRAAAEYLRTHGKCQGAFWDESDRYCTLGALVRVKGADLSKVVQEDWADTWAPYVEALGFLGTGDVYVWSDTSSLDVVLDRLEATALALEVRALAASAESLAAERLEILA